MGSPRGHCSQAGGAGPVPRGVVGAWPQFPGLEIDFCGVGGGGDNRERRGQGSVGTSQVPLVFPGRTLTLVGSLLPVSWGVGFPFPPPQRVTVLTEMLVAEMGQGLGVHPPHPPPAPVSRGPDLGSPLSPSFCDLDRDGVGPGRMFPSLPASSLPTEPCR